MDYIPIKTNSHDLLERFFSVCEERFSYLCEEHGYLPVSGLVEFKVNCKIIRPYQKGDKIPSPFFATMRYEKNDKAVEIVYGDRQYILEIFIYTDTVTRLDFKDIILAMGDVVSDDLDSSFLVDPDGLENKIAWFSDQLQKTPKILNPSEKLIERSLEVRSMLMEHQARRHLKLLMTYAAQEAHKAYNRKDYARVVEVLTPYEFFLDADDKERYTKSRQKLS